MQKERDLALHFRCRQAEAQNSESLLITYLEAAPNAKSTKKSNTESLAFTPYVRKNFVIV